MLLCPACVPAGAATAKTRPQYRKLLKSVCQSIHLRCLSLGLIRGVNRQQLGKQSTLSTAIDLPGLREDTCMMDDCTVGVGQV